MKKTILFLLLLACIAGSSSKAQDVIRLQECNNPDIKRQADSLKQIYTRDGFQVVRETSIAMESEYEMPIVAPLTQGS